MKNNQDYKLECATKDDKEVTKITNYVKTTIPKQINDYKIIVI